MSVGVCPWSAAATAASGGLWTQDTTVVAAYKVAAQQEPYLPAWLDFCQLEDELVHCRLIELGLMPMPLTAVLFQSWPYLVNAWVHPDKLGRRKLYVSVPRYVGLWPL